MSLNPIVLCSVNTAKKLVDILSQMGSNTVKMFLNPVSETADPTIDIAPVPPDQDQDAKIYIQLKDDTHADYICAGLVINEMRVFGVETALRNITNTWKGLAVNDAIISDASSKLGIPIFPVATQGPVED